MFPRVRHCEERSDETIQGGSAQGPGLLRSARNDGLKRSCDPSTTSLKNTNSSKATNAIAC
ncbi:hypothetical protein E5222_03020 [Alteraurantiacibacter aquimixticola]|uniref:Uncharacterized protein n=1 Tax=Alteraurantiacibacter aquimixticola TaxID=2489173 RepID=A0A4T3F2H0_9SPHN|nr:hypothetical protein E5222_03020 [Alteraurantiacibacter aquimixticola]